MPDYRLQYVLKASDQASKVFSQTNRELGQLGQTAKQVGQTLTLGLTTPILGMATAAVKAAGDIDREMRNIQSISKQTNAEIANLSDEFVGMSTDMTRTTDSAAGLARAFYQIQGSGFQGAEGMEVLEAATMAASAGLTRTEVAAGATAAKLNAYGESASEAAITSDMMFRTVDIGVGTFEELANSLGFVVGVAAQAGVGFDEVSAALSTMSKQGIDFQMGARALNMLLLALLRPTDQMSEALRTLGHESGQAALDALGLAGTLQALEDAGYGGTEGMAELGLSTYSLRAALALTGKGADTFAGDLEAMTTASGAAKEAFDIQVQSFDAQVRNFRNTMNSVLIPVGTKLIQEVLIPMAKEMTPVIEALGDLDPAYYTWGLRLGGVAAIAGPLVITIGKLAGVYVGLKTALYGAAAAAAAKTGAMEAQAIVEGAALAKAGLLAKAYAGVAGALAVLLHLGPGILLNLTSQSAQSRTLQGDLAAVEEQIRTTAGSYDLYIVQMQAALDQLYAMHQEWGSAGEAVELMDRGIVLSREEWDQYRASIGETGAALADLGDLTANYAAELETLGPGIGNAAENIAQMGEAFQGTTLLMAEGAQMLGEAYQQFLTPRLAPAIEMMSQGYEQLLITTNDYAQQLLAMEEEFAWSRQLADLNFQMGRQESAAQYHQDVLNSEAQYQAELLALELQGKGMELGNLETAHQQELDQMAWRFATGEAQAQYSYQKQQAMGIVHHKRQEYLEAVAQKAQLEQQRDYFAVQISDWLKQNEALFHADATLYDQLLIFLGRYHTIALGVERDAVSAHIKLQEIMAEASEKGSQATLDAINEVINGYEAAIDAAGGNIDEARDQVNDALAALRDIKIELPPPPDWTAYMPDFGDISRGASQAARGATRAASSHVVDFEETIKDAIAALEELSGYTAPEAIREGAEALKDALLSIIPILRPIDDALDATISREGMTKVREFAQTLRELSDSIQSIYDLAQFEMPVDWVEPFRHLQDVMIDLAWAFEVAQETWDRYLSHDQIFEIQDFANAVNMLAEAMATFQSLAELPDLGPDWATTFLEGFVVNLEALTRKLAELEQEDYFDDLSVSFLELLGAVGGAAGALAQLGRLSEVEPLGPDWAETYLAGFMKGLRSLTEQLAQLAQEEQIADLSIEFLELIEQVGQSVASAQAGLMAIMSRWQIVDMQDSTDAFIEDIDYVLQRLAEQETDWGELDYSGVLNYLSGVVGEIADLVGALSTDFRSQMQPLGYELMMGIKDGIQAGAADVSAELQAAVASIAGGATLPPELLGAGTAGMGAFGGGGLFGVEPAAAAGPQGPPLILAPVFIEPDDYRIAGGEWDLRRLADDLMMVYEQEMR